MKALEIRDFMQKNSRVPEEGSLEALTDEELDTLVKDLSKWKDLEVK
jgi:hypothetical protein